MTGAGSGMHRVSDVKGCRHSTQPKGPSGMTTMVLIRLGPFGVVCYACNPLTADTREIVTPGGHKERQKQTSGRGRQNWTACMQSREGLRQHTHTELPPPTGPAPANLALPRELPACLPAPTCRRVCPLLKGHHVGAVADDTATLLRGRQPLNGISQDLLLTKTHKHTTGTHTDTCVSAHHGAATAAAVLHCCCRTVPLPSSCIENTASAPAV